MTQITLTYEVRNTDKSVKIAPLTGEVKGGFRPNKKKKGEDVFIVAETIAQCLRFLLAHVRSIDLNQFTAKHTEFLINGVKMPNTFIFANALTAETMWSKVVAKMGGLLAISDPVIGDRWARENNKGSMEIGKAKLDSEDVATIAKEIENKETFLHGLRSKIAKAYVWSDSEKALLEKQREYNKAMRIANKENKKISNK